MYTIYIVEDDLTIAQAISRHLESWGYACAIAADFRAVSEEFARLNPHLVLLDISLPFYNGFHWCQEIRRISKAPIVFLSSASDNMNIVMAMNMGGDDFVAKPFDLAVLAAKIQALLRRSYDFQTGGQLLEHKGMILNVADATLSYQGNTLDLSRNEFRILETLFAQKGKVVSREKLMRRLWETDCFVDENTLTVNMTRLRKRLAGIGIRDLITTKKGVGYLLEG